MTTLVWFRGKDLRLFDHAPLTAACRSSAVVPLFILEPALWRPGEAALPAHRTQFLLDSLTALDAQLRACGSRLVLVAGEAKNVLGRVSAAWHIERVVTQRRVEPEARAQEEAVRQELGEARFTALEGITLAPPGALRTSGGGPYAVFTPFARAFAARIDLAAPLAAPKRLPPLPPELHGCATTPLHRGGRCAGIEIAALPSLEALGLKRNPQILAGGEAAGAARLEHFLTHAARHYATARDRMDLPGTSRLSADLTAGTLSARHIWHAVSTRLGRSEGGKVFLNELVWREFAHSTLVDRPELVEQPFRPDFAGFPWRDDAAGWQAWCAGTTGYPVVDAAARQLLGEGFVHNRARMIAASFLCKHLLLDYRRGEAHYMRYLTDGDVAQNNSGWQWSAGCGCDAQPYFRVFNPITQGEKFDPEGDYVRRWVPELTHLPSRYIHQPWNAPAPVLAAANVQLGKNYPRPVVEHAMARGRFLATAAAHLSRARAAKAERRKAGRGPKGA